MQIAYLTVTIVLAAMAAFSGLGKLRRDPKIVHVVHEVVGIPLQYFPHLAACEIAGAVGLVAGNWWPIVGLAAGIGLIVYFAGAIVSHVRVGDLNGIGPAAFLLMISVAAVVLRALSYRTGAAY
ncbi:MAG TPA: DoxX family protein [Candidatus Acidoferrales bacterium]|nr:DoxX family protein [Candidatus Acidoferrales bacterium]HXK03618.1 DoxX family protein [Verrucomicrobiae bacterium]